ncbi:hypothetical protein CIB84_003633 [Bambusicola thoracicus]|uniref:FAM194 C-terminal domain-containing protein n=1 Tax=Bambusicola thoracicus TaxID=9083 RepID=A0A2P4T8D3_BAMTH|nr:hypothetical protein CIB84_003633 [Bambusicola thoracicus]
MEGLKERGCAVQQLSALLLPAAPPGEPSGLDITCAMEFLEDFVELLAQPLRTLPSVGPPAALAYRPEVLRDRLRAEKFCCRRNQDLYEFIVNERKKHESAWNSPISIDSHEPHGSEAERHLAKERAYQRYRRDSWDRLGITMNTAGGQCLDRAGNRVRRWTWPSSTASSGPCAPLSPIFLSLNLHVGVRIMGQDKITVSFLAMGQQAKFNVGTKVQGSQAGQLHAPLQLNEDELLLLALRVRILRLIDKLRGCLNFPSNEQRDKMKPPAYLVTQTLKILYLCTTSDISEELCSSVRAIVNAPF